MTQVIALVALAVLGLTGRSFHEPFCADGGQHPMVVTESNEQGWPAAPCHEDDMTDKTVEPLVPLPNRAVLGRSCRNSA